MKLDPPVRAVVLDIEGTTTPITFVYDALFPYARMHLSSFLAAHGQAAELRDTIARLRDEHRGDESAARHPPPWSDDTPGATLVSAESYARWLMDADRKSTGLKDLQGRIWENGYETGKLVGAVFPDVAAALPAWRAAGLHVAIFSSGSVLAQRLLFGHSSAGDLTPHIDAYFDTTTGAKSDAGSYRRIAAALGQAERDVLFISDVTSELDAARQAGMHTLLSHRPGNPQPPATNTHPVITSFSEIPG